MTGVTDYGLGRKVSASRGFSCPCPPLYLRPFLLFWPRARARWAVSGLMVLPAVLGGGRFGGGGDCGCWLWASGSVAAGVWVSFVPLVAVVLVVYLVGPDVGRPPVAGRRWACWLACSCVRAPVSGFARGTFGDLGVSVVVAALSVGGVCRVVS